MPSFCGVYELCFLLLSVLVLQIACYVHMSTTATAPSRVLWLTMPRVTDAVVQCEVVRGFQGTPSLTRPYVYGLTVGAATHIYVCRVLLDGVQEIP